MSRALALAEVEATLHEWVGSRGFSGTVLVSGELDWQRCFGLANRAESVPVHTGTRFGVASFTKMLTAVCVVSVLAERDLPYESRVVDLLPPARRPSTLSVDATVHHLLTHTSGIADYYEEDDGDEDNDTYALLWTERPSYRMRRAVDFLPLFADLQPYEAPGGRWHYSNAGYILLGLLIEELTGQSYLDVVRERVLEPAGMLHSGFFPLDEAWPDVATGYLRPLADGLPWRSNIYSIPVVGGPDGGLFATAGDIDKFLRALHSGALVAPAQRDAMLARHAEVEEPIAYGYGCYLFPGPGGPRWGHGGQDPGVEMIAYRWADRDLTLVVMCNMTGLTGDIRDLVLPAVLDQG